MNSELYASPRVVTDVAQCSFYHTMDLPTIGTVNGQWDLRGRINDYLAGTSVKGKRVLDIGCASGFLSFEMEKLGATVVSFDAADASSIAFLPFAESLYTRDRAKWSADVNVFLDTLKNSYWLAHRLYSSNNRVHYGDVYDLPAAVGQFDVVVVGQVLIHLKDPISALASVARRCSGTLVITEGMIDSDDRIARFNATAKDGPEWIWWQYSTGLYRELMGILGFEVQKLVSARYPCSHSYLGGETEVHTLVATRKSSSFQV